MQSKNTSKKKKAYTPKHASAGNARTNQRREMRFASQQSTVPQAQRARPAPQRTPSYSPQPQPGDVQPQNIPLPSEAPLPQNPPQTENPTQGLPRQSTQAVPHGENAPSSKTRAAKKDRAQKKSGRIAARIAVCFFTLLFLLVGGIMGVITVIMYGPSPTARDLLVTSVLETSALKFIATMYFDQAEIDTILANNSVQVSDAVTDTDLIQFTPEEVPAGVEPLVIETVSGGTFNGKMMIVQDPSRVMVGTSADTFTGEAGMTVQEIIQRHGGVGGTNAGGFSDPGGVGNGGTPLGIVMSGGELLWGGRSTPYELIGIDNDNKLVVGTMTPDEAISRGIRDAVSFGPALIVNGEMMEITGSGGGLNPRTAIGQRADGAMLLLVCDGRQANSIGASMSDVAEVMAQYGAVNAANLDGGSSTIMYYEDELINVSSSLYGPRDIPTSIVVLPEVA